jgi:amino acid transporter
MIAVLGSLIVLLLLGAGIFATLYYTAGPDLFQSLVWAWSRGSEVYKLPHAMPDPLALMGYVTDNVPLITATGLLWFIGFLTFPISVIFVFSRNIFAWSFDRVLPASFSALTRRTGAPWICIILAIIIAEVWSFLYAQTTLAAYVVYNGIGWSVAWTIVGLAGTLFPYLRRDLFEAAPEVVKKRVGGIPLLSIFGVITMAYSILMGYAIATPEYTGTLPSEGVIYSTLLVIVLLLAGPVIYAISYVYHKRKGIELHLAHRELPVE